MKQSKLRAPFHTEEVENNWAISYGDMITLLLGFFVLFFNIKTEMVNIHLIKKDLDQYFDSSNQSNRQPTAITDSSNNQGSTISTNLSQKLKVKSNIEGEKILVEFPGVSFFDQGSFSLTQDGQNALKDFASAISNHMGLFRLVVRGYTDGKAVKANARYKDNLELSAFRSISAIRYLSQKGVKLENMRIAGYGESSLSRQAKVKDQEGVQRKVVIVIEPLDHTEKMPVMEQIEKSGAKIMNQDTDSKKASEREVASVASNQGLAVFTSLEMPKIGDIEFMINQVAIDIDLKIGQTSWYQTYLNYMVKKDLMKKGYSREQAEELVKEFDKNRGLQ